MVEYKAQELSIWSLHVQSLSQMKVLMLWEWRAMPSIMQLIRNTMDTSAVRGVFTKYLTICFF